jgi:hypothetical protein
VALTLTADEAGNMKTDVSPMFLTYFMVKWDEIGQRESDQKCSACGRIMMKTETFTDQTGSNYQGYVCHTDKRVTWLKVSQP